MFAGIVEACASIRSVRNHPQVIKITVEIPPEWDDLKGGDSVAVNGICLTVEEFSSEALSFSLAPETLRVSSWAPNTNERVNLERSLRFGDRVHGHFVNGHVDESGRVSEIVDGDGIRDITIEFSSSFAPFVWRKGSVAIHGVSLTVNEASADRFRVGVIPETLRRTNLGLLKKGDRVNLEADAMARAWFHWRNPK